MKITKAEARHLELLVGQELREASRLLKLKSVDELKRVSEKNDLRTWNRLFRLEPLLRSESINPENEEGLS